MRTPTQAVWKLRRALQSLVERGVEGEADVAGGKLARLESRYDFSAGEMGNLFSGTFHRSERAVFLATFPPGEIIIAGFVKWAIENGAKIPALWRNDGMMSDAWPTGKALPASTPLKKQKRGTGDARPGLTLHPYSVAVELGQGIRFNTPIAELTDQLSATVARLASS